MKTLFLFVLLHVPTNQLWGFDLPAQCVSKKIYPCAFSMITPGTIAFKSKELNLYSPQGNQFVFLSPDSIVLVAGKMWYSGCCATIRAQNAIIRVQEPSVWFVQVSRDQVHVVVLRGKIEVSDMLRQDRLLRIEQFQQVTWYLSHPGMIQPLSDISQIVSHLTGFPRAILGLLPSHRQLLATQSAQHLATLYRSVAQSYLDEEENSYREWLRKQQRKQKEDERYRFWFRQRLFHPESWQKFLDDPNFDSNN